MKTCLITGGTSGIGRVAAQALAASGAHVFIVGRDRARGDAVIRDIQKTGGHAEFFALDLSSMAAVRQLATDVQARTGDLDLLINNAGLVRAERHVTVDGFEQIFAVNHLAPFLLTQLLRAQLVAAGAARVITVASAAHTMLKSLDFENLQSQKRFKPILAYAQSKLENVLFTRELARRLAGTTVTANCLHPGVIRTGIWRENRGVLKLTIGLAWPFLLSAEQGAQALLKLAVAPEVDGLTGQYFDKLKMTPPSPAALDDQTAARLWEVSERLAGIA